MNNLSDHHDWDSGTIAEMLLSMGSIIGALCGVLFLFYMMIKG